MKDICNAANCMQELRHIEDRLKGVQSVTNILNRDVWNVNEPSEITPEMWSDYTLTISVIAELMKGLDVEVENVLSYVTNQK